MTFDYDIIPLDYDDDDYTVWFWKNKKIRPRRKKKDEKIHI